MLPQPGAVVAMTKRGPLLLPLLALSLLLLLSVLVPAVSTDATGGGTVTPALRAPAVGAARPWWSLSHTKDSLRAWPSSLRSQALGALRRSPPAAMEATKFGVKTYVRTALALVPMSLLMNSGTFKPTKVRLYCGSPRSRSP